MNDKRQQFKRRVIELIHGLPYEEAIEIDCIDKIQIGMKCSECGNDIERGYSGEYYNCCMGASKVPVYRYTEKPITIGRVMQAMQNKFWQVGDTNLLSIDESFLVFHSDDRIDLEWLLTKKNGQEATDDSQSDETIDALLKLLK